MQVIDPTFRSYAMPGFNTNIWDPLSNMLASIRYSVSRYGSLARAWRGTGYKNGGNVPFSKWTWVGEDGPELVELPGGSSVTKNKKSNSLLSRVLSFGKSSGNTNQPIEIVYNPQYIIQGNADQETIERVNIKSYEEFKRWMKQYESDKNRISFN